MAGVITTGNHPKALWPGVKAWWGNRYKEHTEEYPLLFTMDTDTRAYVEDVQTSGFGLVPVKPQGRKTTYDTDLQGFISRYIHLTYSLGYIVTEEELEDNLYATVAKTRAQSLAYSFRQTKENVAANVYNRAFSGSYLGGDGVSLINTAHPSRAGTFSNQLTIAADISESALEDLCIQIMGAVGNRGLKINLIPQILLVHRSDWFEANRILKSSLQADTANNAINVLKMVNAFPKGIHVNHYFTDSDAFFVRTDCPRGMRGFQRIPISFKRDNDFDTGNAKAKSRERYSFKWTDPRDLWASPGA